MFNIVTFYHMVIFLRQWIYFCNFYFHANILVHKYKQCPINRAIGEFEFFGVVQLRHRVNEHFSNQFTRRDRIYERIYVDPRQRWMVINQEQHMTLSYDPTIKYASMLWNYKREVAESHCINVFGASLAYREFDKSLTKDFGQQK